MSTRYGYTSNWAVVPFYRAVDAIMRSNEKLGEHS
jgi:hypothetical protein